MFPGSLVAKFSIVVAKLQNYCSRKYFVIVAKPQNNCSISFYQTFLSFNQKRAIHVCTGPNVTGLQWAVVEDGPPCSHLHARPGRQMWSGRSHRLGEPHHFPYMIQMENTGRVGIGLKLCVVYYMLIAMRPWSNFTGLQRHIDVPWMHEHSILPRGVWVCDARCVMPSPARPPPFNGSWALVIFFVQRT
jgi:hypothetical protein